MTGDAEIRAYIPLLQGSSIYDSFSALIIQSVSDKINTTRRHGSVTRLQSGEGPLANTHHLLSQSRHKSVNKNPFCHLTADAFTEKSRCESMTQTINPLACIPLTFK